MDRVAGKPAETIAVAVVAFVIVTAAVWHTTEEPSLASSAREEPPAALAPEPAPAPTRSIMGTAAIDADTMKLAWLAAGRSQPPRLNIGISELIDIYYAEGSAEGVRADWAFVQAIHETGWFTNVGTTYNNFSGIAHCDTCAGGLSYGDPTIGVRAQMQLLRRVAEGNNIPHAFPVVAPVWQGHHVGRWDELGGDGRWATDPYYWPKLANLYTQLGGQVPGE